MSPNQRISIEINGKGVMVEAGRSILEAARENGIEIPTLCDFPGLPPHGSCRLCVVEIDGKPNTPTACTTPVEEGMIISTHSPKVIELRRELLQLLLAEHPSGCLYCPEKARCDECMVTLRKAGVTTGCGSCPKDGQCELQFLAEEYGISQPGYPIRYRMLPVETRDPFFDRDPNLCILCGRCIRVCKETHSANTLSYSGRGAQALVSTAFHRPHLQTACNFCGSCVEVCPTGAITEKTRKWDGEPERETASTCPFCSLGCQITLLSKGERVIGSLPNHHAGTDALCVNGRFAVTELVDPNTRLTQPQQMAEGAWQPTGWEEAARLAAEKLAGCPPERFMMYVSAFSSNEDLFVARQFAQAVMQTSPILASAQKRYGGVFDILARLLQRSEPVEVLAETADAFLCAGLDDRYAQSVVSMHLKRAKSRGAQIVHLGAGQPVQEAGERLFAQSSAPAIFVGAAALADPQNASLLHEVEVLVQNQGARVAVLPEESNLAGALRLGLSSAPKTSNGASPELDVLFLIGEPLPDNLAGAPFILSHVMSVPEGGAFNGLLLPASAFSEEFGTLIDHAGRMQEFRPAVMPPGEALPVWKILSRIARQMGAAGFEYTCVEDIWQAAQTQFPGFPAQHGLPEMAEVVQAQPITTAPWREPVYMGIPLSQRVAGLRSLYPGFNSTRAHE